MTYDTYAPLATAINRRAISRGLVLARSTLVSRFSRSVLVSFPFYVSYSRQQSFSRSRCSMDKS